MQFQKIDIKKFPIIILNPTVYKNCSVDTFIDFFF